MPVRYDTDLNWITTLKKADNFRASYNGFDIDKIASYDETDRGRLLSNAGIIRNLLKVNAAIEMLDPFSLCAMNMDHSKGGWIAMIHKF